MEAVTLAHTDQSSEAPADQAFTKTSPFQNNRTRPGFPDRVPAALFGSSFAFVVNGAVIESDIAEAAALSPFVREQLSVDYCAREFVLCESSVGPSAIASFQNFVSGSAISVGHSEVLLSGHFGNARLECHFLVCAKAGIAATLSQTVIEKRMAFESADFAGLSFEPLDDLLLRSSVMIESEDDLLRVILSFRSYRFLLKHIQPGFLSAESVSLLMEHFEIPHESAWESAVEVITLPPPLQLDSLIISDFPAIFAEFRGKQFKLLWRGSRDGFSAFDFHSRCDGHPNTITVILDTVGNIFGGFTPVEWDSTSQGKEDESRESFLFTVKNPHNLAARRFALRPEEEERAIVCDSKCGPGFDDLSVSDNCNANTNSYTYFFGDTYLNDTQLKGETVFAGSGAFQVKEIEVFEIID
jgi:hypothetical protein